MADTIFSVRIDEDTKIKFAETAKELGINNKDFMEILISNYELHKSTNESKLDIQSDVGELQHITKRMMDIYVNLVERMTLSDKEKNQIVQKALADKDSEIENLVKALELEKATNKELSSFILDLQKNIEELKKRNESVEELQGNFNSFKTMLEDKVANLKEELKNKTDELQNITEINKELSKTLENKAQLEEISNNYKEENLSLKDKLNNIKATFEKEMFDLKHSHEKNMSFMKDKLELEKTKEILSLKEENYEKLQKQQSEFSNKNLELLKELQELKEILSKVKE
ncbi:hypothetical protein SAMN02745196_00660 [Clostridium collagenovorans DSM 3089]|uniref:Uncharacterized protein n=1 Tax=Clostridium collagenovorans DSM 3089 TaxID=1121306 RepID=A0A1M5TPA6_9CLOT|nr:hypothetical protein [Clostridium collagenovorans]SHH52466.1 hypothetical protein SAMN02745196_00660 [Clostridium collagenovorans DSM 3089]